MSPETGSDFDELRKIRMNPEHHFHCADNTMKIVDKVHSQCWSYLLARSSLNLLHGTITLVDTRAAPFLSAIPLKHAPKALLSESACLRLQWHCHELELCQY